MIVLVVRAHPEPTQTFHRRMAAALARVRPDTRRVALRRVAGATDRDDATTFPRENGARAWRTFVRRPLRSTALLCRTLAHARPRNKEGGIAGAVLAWRDGLMLADALRDARGLTRLHAQFASWEATSALVAAALLGCAFSFELHNPYTLVRGRATLAWKLRAADVVTAISKDVRDRAAALAPQAAARIRIVRCGVDRATLPPRGADADDVLAVGSLVPRKGHDVLVRACARLAARRPGLRASIVGEGPERAALTREIERTHAPVRLAGALAEADALARTVAARVAVLACRKAPDGDEDGVPVALLEAMAAGTPVVSTRVGAIPELLEEGEAGLLVAQGDDAALAAAIERLLDDEALRARVVARAHRVIDERHDLARCALALAQLLDPPAGPAASAAVTRSVTGAVT